LEKLKVERESSSLQSKASRTRKRGERYAPPYYSKRAGGSRPISHREEGPFLGRAPRYKQGAPKDSLKRGREEREKTKRGGRERAGGGRNRCSKVPIRSQLASHI